MSKPISIPLRVNAEQQARLAALQQVFAAACNALAPIARDNRCWNRVALHHLAYRDLRERFPQIGSQMACNAIYSVSRACRLVYQHPRSPWNLSRLGERPLPLVKFQAGAPVYFDRHTLSLKHGQLSLFTLDGRIHFSLDISSEDEERFHREKLREVVLTPDGQGFRLMFFFVDGAAGKAAESDDELPEYVVITEAASAASRGTETSSRVALPASAAA